MNSGTTARKQAAAEAAALARECRCLACNHEPPSLAAHYPTHRGMGAGKAGWSVEEWVPLCFNCHETLDHRASPWGHYSLDFIVSMIEQRRARWLEKGYW